MLIQFTVENFLSIRDKVYLSLEPSKNSEHPENLITKGDYNAVTSAAIYGANASGKTSLFKQYFNSFQDQHGKYSIRFATGLETNPAGMLKAMEKAWKKNELSEKDGDKAYIVLDISSRNR